MPDLTPVGLSKDGSRLVLRSEAGAEFTVVVDHRFRAALRGDDTRLAQLETPMHSALRPRDIQSRIRSGQSPEAVAAAAGTTVDRISAFAEPVLAERAHVAERARRSTVRRRTGSGSGDGTVGLLGDTVTERLRDREVDPGSVEWDAWRRDDGRWALVVDYPVGGVVRRAGFVYDPAGRYVVADDDESRWLVGERGADPAARRPVQDAGQLPLGADAIELVTGEPAGSVAEPAESDAPTTDLTGAVAAVRELSSADREEPAADGTPDPADPRGPVVEEDQQPAERPRRQVRRTKGRAAVPSWDEIMFGSGGD